MTRRLPLTDFRAVRSILEPHEFALGGEGEAPPPSNLIDEETWNGIMHLPDDAAVRITDHNGTRLKLIYDLWGDWIVAGGDDPDHPDELFGCMLDAADCFQCATFDFVHGYYRAALANLRGALELVMIGTFGNLNSADSSYIDWKNGNAELGFTRCRKALLKMDTGQGSAWLFDDNAFPASTFKQLCNFTHSRPNSSDGALWESNGPVYNNAAIMLTFRMTLRVYAICYLLVRLARPTFKLPEDSHILFKLDWLENHAESAKACRELYA